MQELWSDDPKIIGKEIFRIVGQQFPVTLLQNGVNPRGLTPIEILNTDTGPLLIFTKNSTYQTAKSQCLFLYRHHKQPMQSFQANIVLETSHELGVLFPTSIMKIQRRKHPRHTTSSSSIATFTRKASRYLNHGSIQDSSIEGAKLVGKFSEHLRKEDKISPLCMTLRIKMGGYEEKITASEAIVRRVIELGQETRELGIQFTLTGTDLEILEDYLVFCAVTNSKANPT